MKKKKLCIVIGAVAAILLVTAGIAGIYFFSGKTRLRERIQCVGKISEDQREYDSSVYQEELVNILLLGIDKEEKMWEVDDDGGSLGQADAIFVVSLNLEKEQMNIISIPRDTMVDIRLNDEERDYRESWEAQICLQYAVGDGQASSCELMMDCVSELLGIPLHGYAAVNLEMIPIINDVVGGVDITVEGDYTFINPDFVEGAQLHLMGTDALDYLQGRDIDEAGSAYHRLDRHKQYMQAFYQQAKTKLSEDPLVIFSLLQTMSGYVETNLGINEIAYLVQMGKKCDFDEGHVWILEGNIVQGEVYEEYYLDQEKKEELVRELFYGGT